MTYPTLLVIVMISNLIIVFNAHSILLLLGASSLHAPAFSSTLPPAHPNSCQFRPLQNLGRDIHHQGVKRGATGGAELRYGQAGVGAAETQGCFQELEVQVP